MPEAVFRKSIIIRRNYAGGEWKEWSCVILWKQAARVIERHVPRGASSADYLTRSNREFIKSTFASVVCRSIQNAMWSVGLWVVAAVNWQLSVD